jgi:AcrR family transcriptional regulator
MTIKENIMATAAELFLEKGIHGTSTKSIITAAGVSNGALFNHFANKDELVLAIYQMYKDDLRNALKSALDTDDGIRKFLFNYWTATINWSLNNPLKKKFILTFALQPNVISCMKNYDPSKYDFLIPKITKAIEDEEIIAEDMDHFSFIFVGLTDGIVNYLNHNPNADRDKVIHNGFQQFWRSIVNF